MRRALLALAAREHTRIEREVRQAIRAYTAAAGDPKRLAEFEAMTRARLIDEANERLQWAAAEHGAEQAHHRGPTT